MFLSHGPVKFTIRKRRRLEFDPATSPDPPHSPESLADGASLAADPADPHFRLGTQTTSGVGASAIGSDAEAASAGDAASNPDMACRGGAPRCAPYKERREWRDAMTGVTGYGALAWEGENARGRGRGSEAEEEGSGQTKTDEKSGSAMDTRANETRERTRELPGGAGQSGGWFARLEATLVQRALMKSFPRSREMHGHAYVR